MRVLTPPNRPKHPAWWQPNGISIFLAGSIEMGVAENWQDRVINDLRRRNVTIFNPRRADWDASWVQSINNPQFNEQVTWELDHLTTADIAIFYFDPTTKSPITLMELGLVASQHSLETEVVVCCPPGFWRKGNVDILCDRYDIPVFETYVPFISYIKSHTPYL